MKRLSTIKNSLTKLMGFSGLFILSGLTFAFGQEAVAASTGTSELEIIKWLGISSGLALGIAAFGCGMGQGKLVASALDGIARNPEASDRMFVYVILGLAFIEALTIYALVFGFVFKTLVMG